VESLSGVYRWVYDLGDWLAKMMYLHFLWVLFTVLGLGVFGVFPATIALFTVIQQWFKKEVDTPFFKGFYSVYKDQFLKSNTSGYTLVGIGAFLYLDMTISQTYIQSFYIHLFLLIIFFVYLLTFLYFFPVFARYRLNFFSYFKQSLFIAIARPPETLAMVICLFLLYYLFRFLPIAFFFVGSSIIAYPLAWFSFRSFLQIEQKKLT
jgi:uncharacterized membrane protein YesL